MSVSSKEEFREGSVIVYYKVLTQHLEMLI
jgi:hypothetical protein